MPSPDTRRSPLGSLFAAALLLGGVALALLLVGVSFDLRSQLLFSGVLLTLAIVVNRIESARVTHMLVLATLLVTTRYMYWRVTSTLVFDDPFSAAAGYTLFGAEAYAYLVTLLGYLQMIRPLRRRLAPLPADPERWPTVDVFIPTYNEPLHVVAATVAGALNLEWPRERLSIHLLDDGDRPEFRRLAAEAGVHYRTRQDNHGAKAGNLNAAIAVTRGELIAIFDCDHVPARSFLQVTAGWFLKDDNLAQLQTPHHFYNPDPIERNLRVHGDVPGEGSLFYGLIQDGNDLWNATFFCGSCALIRRTALEEVGGIAIETVTEDAHTSLKLHQRGWSSAYINLIQAAGLATETLAAHVNQRIRWARGLSQMLRLDNPLLARGLNLAQRLCYLSAMLHFLYAVPRIVFLLAPLFFLFFDLYVIQAEALMVAAMALPHLLHSNLTTARMHGRWRRAFWAEIYETILSFYILMPTLIALIAPSRGKFNVTEKGAITDRDYFSIDVARPFVAIAVLNFAGIAVGLHALYIVGDPAVGTTWLNMAWATYNLIIVGVALAVACETRQTRDHFRRPLAFRSWLATAEGYRIAANTCDLSESGVAVTLDAVALDAPLENVERLVVEGNEGAISLPVALVADERPLLRLSFTELSFAERRALVGLLYSPADTWLDADRLGRPLGAARALLGIVGFGLRGWVRVLGLSLAPGEPRRPSAARAHARTGASVPERPAGSAGPEAERAPLSDDALPGGGAVRTAVLVVLGVALALTGGLFAARPAAAETPIVYEMDMLSDRVGETIELGRSGVDFRLPFAVRRDSVVERLMLSLDLSWHDFGETGQRRLVLSLNGETVWRAERVVAGHERFELELPGVALDEYNTLSFALERPDALACSGEEDAPFEFVVHEDSRLVLDAQQISLANELDSLPLPFFDPRDPRTARLTLVMPTVSDPATLRAAGDLAGWFGRLAGYRGARFDVAYGQLPRGNAVVLASGRDVPGGLAVPSVGRASISLLDNPRDPARQILLLHAPSTEGLTRAVSLLEAQVSAGRVRAAGTHPYDAPRWVPSGVPVRLQDLPGMSAEDLGTTGDGFATFAIPFSLPGDFHEPPRARHRLRVEYRYGPDRPGVDERLHVLFNGREVESVPLGDRSGDVSLGEQVSTFASRWLGTLPNDADDGTGNRSGGGSDDDPANGGAGDGVLTGTLELTLPADSLRTDNRLELRFAAAADSSRGCDGKPAAISPASIEARILPGSTLQLDDGGHIAALPDLALLANSGIPFTREADLSSTTVVLPSRPAEHEVALMMTVLGRMAALSGTIPRGVTIDDGVPDAGRANRIVIGSPGNEAAARTLLESTPLTLAGNALSLDFADPRKLYRALASFTTPALVERRLTALPRARGGRLPLDEGRALIAGMRTPGTDTGTTLLLYAPDARGGDSLARALVERRRIGELRGTAAIVDADGVTALRTGTQYLAGDLSPPRAFAWWLGLNLPVALALSVLAALLFCLGLPPLLERVARRRLGD